MPDQSDMWLLLGELKQGLESIEHRQKSLEADVKTIMQFRWYILGALGLVIFVVKLGGGIHG